MSDAPTPQRPSVNGWNGQFLDEQFDLYKADPASVPPETRAFFQGFELASSQSPGAGKKASGEASSLQAGADGLIAAYRGLGHVASKLDPFGRTAQRPPALSLEFHGLSQADLDSRVDATSIGLDASTPLRNVIENLERTYCGTVAIEIMHIQDRDERMWLLERVERNGGRIDIEKGLRVHVLEQLTRAEAFEKFLGKRYPGEKRFSLEGGESLIPLLDRLIEELSNHGTDEIVLGMAHRGRLNVLCNTMGKTYEQIFTEFEESWEDDFASGGGDVKYHRGYSATRVMGNGKSVHLAMASNPSHLEAVGPVVMGRTRAKQRLRGDKDKALVTPVVIHGDAAIIGQGIVAEAMNMSQLDGYSVGGSIHVVVNNMIGFTTLPEDGRSSRYCTDFAKGIDAPIFHVNGEDPEAVITAATIAAEYRRRFGKDVYIDMYCYRRFGHNEQDETSFTQPLMAQLIKEKQSTLSVYAERLLGEGVISEKDISSIRRRLDEALELAQKAARETPQDPTIEPGSARWSGLGQAYSFEEAVTAVDPAVIAEVCGALGRVREGFKVNRKLQRLLSDRAALPDTKKISYADAESIAFGTLLMEGVAVRVSGQDSRRGTFSHRHAVLRDAESAEPYLPLNHIGQMGEPGTDHPPGTQTPDGGMYQAKLCVYDSPLSEASVLAFEYGYSLADPKMLVCWEAQFGDFVNGAQVIIDQFLAGAESKWQRWSGLTLLLPHGYEGAGPEHSSARMERFLQLCGEDNMQVCYPSTAAQTFHMFRRQVRREFRKPLIVFTPKSMLRVPTSDISELSAGTFQDIMDDPGFSSGTFDRSKVKRVVYATGKLTHELTERRDARGDGSTAIIRVEQIYPFNAERARSVDALYPKGAERCWAQEEPRNMGAYLFVADQFRNELGFDPRYIGRRANSTPAVGAKAVHKVEQEQLLTDAVGPKPAQPEKTDQPQPAKASA
ncbi:MAG: 2-oxoglutarate dehydrogenase E1 component [Planctomycetota bacterium]